MKIGIIILGVLLFILLYFRSAKNTPESENESRELFNKLIQDEYKEELNSVVDRSKGDFENIKLLREKYNLTILDSKNLWDRVKTYETQENDFSSKVQEDYSDIQTVIDRTKGDIYNIKLIREYYGIGLKEAKELWDSIR
ncbi:hypothetical protein [Gemella cuniculi]|uniref:hypothetical protein n=1 Tax=Gemella cuniculi TaxID=150240 RepID=UPI00040BA813|nr:hypothetical protein [Gemella cuniculi]